MIVVTGGAGFIGSAMVWELNRQGINDILVVDHLGEDQKWKNLRGLKFSDYVEKDVFLQALCEGQWDHIDAIIHLGACSATTEQDATYLVVNNFEYSKILISYALEHKIRMIYASSAATYGDGAAGYSDTEMQLHRFKPLNMYGFSKHMIDQWALQNDVLDKVVALKYFNVFGPNESHKGSMRSMMHKAFEQISDKGSLNLFKSYRPEYKDGEQQRDFLYVKDAVKMTAFFLHNRNAGGIYNIGSGKARSWNDVARCVFKEMKRPESIVYVDMPAELRNQYQYFTQANIDKLRQAGYADGILSLEDSIKDYVGNYLSRGVLLGEG